jgi:CheY-like chemotaxis protein
MMEPENKATGGADRPQVPTILVVEDEWIVRMSIADYLRECGYHVLEAGNVAEAIRLLEADSSIAVVFSDVQMPGGIDGWGLCRWVRRERRGVKVIMTSGVTSPAEAAHDLCEDGPLMPKPYSRSELESRIRGLLINR